MHFLNFFVLSLYHGGKTLWFCFVSSYFSSVKCFLFCDLSKHFKVHCNAFEKSLGHLTFPHGNITWFETIDTCTKMSVIHIPWKPWHLLAQNRYRCSLSHNLSERNGFAFSARKKSVFEILKTLKKRKRKKKTLFKDARNNLQWLGLPFCMPKNQSQRSFRYVIWPLSASHFLEKNCLLTSLKLKCYLDLLTLNYSLHLNVWIIWYKSNQKAKWSASSFFMYFWYTRN